MSTGDEQGLRDLQPVHVPGKVHHVALFSGTFSFFEVPSMVIRMLIRVFCTNLLGLEWNHAAQTSQLENARKERKKEKKEGGERDNLPI